MQPINVENSTIIKEVKQGIYQGISNSDYHAHPAISNSYLSRLAECPASAKVSRKITPAMIIGSASHSLILEGEEQFLKEFCIAPECDKRTKEGKALFADFRAANEGKTVINASDFIRISEMREAVWSHPMAALLLNSGKAEQSVFWTDPHTGIECKCRPDWIPDGGSGIIVDLKTTTDADNYVFGKSVTSRRYYQQAAMYLDGINTVTDGFFDAFVFITVEQEAPYRCEVYQIDEDFIQAGRAEYQRLLQIELECKEKGEYPNRQSNEIVMLYRPKYI